MAEGRTPAPWFLEVDGQKQGPYTSQQIMKLLMDGALKIQSRIFDSQAGLWKIAADVIPYLDLNAPESGAKKTWQPPPRPAELRDVHIVALNEQDTGEIDYFALLNDNRKQFESNRAAEAAAVTAARVQSTRQAAEARLRPEQAEPGQRRGMATDFRKPGSSPVEPAFTNAPTAKSTKSGSGNAPGTATPKPRATAIKADTDGMMGKVLVFARRGQRFTTEHKSAISIAAGLCFVFAGTYGVVRTLAERDSRKPANVQTPVAELNPTANLIPNQARSTKIAMSEDDSLGTGKHHIKRANGGVGARMAHQAHPTAPAPQATTEPTPPPRDPPQYYSSADPGNTPNENQPPVAVPPIGTIQPPAVNNENGAVQPPAFVPQPQADPNLDPNRNPADTQPQQAPLQTQ